MKTADLSIKIRKDLAWCDPISYQGIINKFPRKASVTYHKKDPLSVSYLCTSRLIIFKYECASCRFMEKGLEKLLLLQNVFIACELTFSSVQLQSHIH